MEFPGRWEGDYGKNAGANTGFSRLLSKHCDTIAVKGGIKCINRRNGLGKSPPPYTKTFREDPEFADAHFNLGRVVERVGDSPTKLT